MKWIKEFLKPNWWKIVIFIIFILLLLFLLIVYIYLGSQRTDRGAWPHVRPDLEEIRKVAEVIYSEESSYENLSCQPSSPYGEQMESLCNDIETYGGSKPIIHSTKDKYCAYAKTEGGSFWCADSDWRSKQYNTEPSATCNGISFNCE